MCSENCAGNAGNRVAEMQMECRWKLGKTHRTGYIDGLEVLDDEVGSVMMGVVR